MSMHLLQIIYIKSLMIRLVSLHHLFRHPVQIIPRVIVKTLELDSETREALFDAIKAEYSDATTKGSDFISGSVSDDLRSAAIKASLLAIVLILLYITVRFEFRSGLAVITLCHDICVILAFFAIFQLPLNINFIAAALTILGYSINATIVIFDRIRENSKGISSIEVFGDITDRSIKQTLARSINTSITTLIPILLILILGCTVHPEFCNCVDCWYS